MFRYNIYLLERSHFASTSEKLETQSNNRTTFRITVIFLKELNPLVVPGRERVLADEEGGSTAASSTSRFVDHGPGVVRGHVVLLFHLVPLAVGLLLVPLVLLGPGVRVVPGRLRVPPAVKMDLVLGVIHGMPTMTKQF